MVSGELSMLRPIGAPSTELQGRKNAGSDGVTYEWITAADPVTSIRGSNGRMCSCLFL